MEPLLTLNEVAQRLSISKYTLKERIREAGINGPRPGREMQLTERDYQALVEHMRQRRYGGYADAQAAKAAVTRMRTAATRRLGKKHHGPVVSLDLERKGH